MFRTGITVVATDPRIRARIEGAGFESFRGSEGSAGYDLHACLDNGRGGYILEPGQVLMVDTGMSIHIGNAGFCALVLPRSGLASKQKLVPINSPGLIDSDYQGPLKVALHNKSDKAQVVNDFDRIAQLVFMPVVNVSATLVDAHSAITARGKGGFGSTGS